CEAGLAPSLPYASGSAVGERLASPRRHPPAPLARLGHASLHQDDEHVVLEDEVAGFFVQALERDPFEIGHDAVMSDLEVLRLHERLLSACGVGSKTCH